MAPNVPSSVLVVETNVRASAQSSRGFGETEVPAELRWFFVVSQYVLASSDTRDVELFGDFLAHPIICLVRLLTDPAEWEFFLVLLGRLAVLVA